MQTNWIYKDNYFDESIADEFFGFVYKITFDDDKVYYGQKQFWSYNEKDALKNGNKREGHIKFLKRRAKGKLLNKELVRSSSNWKKYNGSSKNIGNKKVKSKQILILCKTKLDLTYWETYALFVKKVLFDTNCLNENILGKFHCRKELTGSKNV
jgi:hypothetical protein